MIFPLLLLFQQTYSFALLGPEQNPTSPEFHSLWSATGFAPWAWVGFWAGTVLVVALTTLRRAFLDTSPAVYRRVFTTMNMGGGFDEAAKLHRIGVMLNTSAQFCRILWVLLYAPLRLGMDSFWQLPESLTASLVWAHLLIVAVELLVLSVLLLELVPQVLATWRGERLASASLAMLCRVELFLSPFSRSYLWLRSALLRFVGTSAETEAEMAEAGIREAVEIGEREGVLQAGEKSMIESVLEFHEAEISEVMTPRTDMVCFDEKIKVSEAAELAIQCGHSRIPVYREDVDDIIGVLYVKDLLKYTLTKEERDRPIGKVLRKTNFVPETKKIEALLTEFRAERFHVAVVLDEYGGTSGLVTIEDIIEEIVGEIEDEFDSGESEMIQNTGPGTFELDGRASVDDLNQVVGTSVPESDDYETIAGFLMSSLGRVPKEGDDFAFADCHFEVTSADERKVKRVRLVRSKMQ